MANPIRELVIKVTVDADTSGFKEMDSAQGETTTGSVALGTVIGNLTASLIENGLAAAKAAAVYAKDLVFGTAAAADEVAKMADRLKVGTDQLQRLRGAAQLSGAAAGDLDSGIKDLTKNLGEAVEKGTGPAVEALATLGLEVEDVESLLADGDVEGALGIIGDAANELGDDTRSSAALLKLMGDAGSKLRPLLDAGTEGVRAMGDQISATGSVINDEMLDEFEAMNDAAFLAEQRFEGIKTQLAGALGPAVTDAANLVADFVAENQEFISQDLPVIIADVAAEVVVLVKDTIELVGIWREFIRDASDLAEVLGEDVDPALGSVGEGMASLGNFADGVSLALLDMLEGFLETIGAGEALIKVIKEVRKEVLGDSGPKGTRGAPGFKGGGTALVNPTTAQQADSSGDTTKLRKIAADPRFSAADQQKAAAQADSIDTREAAKAQAEAATKAEERQKSISSSRARSKSARKRGGGGGGGGKRAAAATADEPGVDELIASAIGTATGQPSQVASSNALAGTMLINVDQSINITQGPVTIAVEVPASIAESGNIEALADLMAERFVPVDALVIANDFFEARQNVGAG